MNAAEDDRLSDAHRQFMLECIERALAKEEAIISQFLAARSI